MIAAGNLPSRPSRSSSPKLTRSKSTSQLTPPPLPRTFSRLNDKDRTEQIRREREAQRLERARGNGPETQQQRENIRRAALNVVMKYHLEGMKGDLLHADSFRKENAQFLKEVEVHQTAKSTGRDKSLPTPITDEMERQGRSWHNELEDLQTELTRHELSAWSKKQDMLKLWKVGFGPTDFPRKHLPRAP